MRYNRFRDYLARSSRDMRNGRDMRNPYGSQGGYVVSGRRSDYGYERMGDMARNRQYGGSNNDRFYPMYDFAEGGNYNQSNRQSNDYYGNMNYYPVRRKGTFDYNTYGSDFDYDMARGRDYAENEFKLTPTEIRKWEKELKKNGGSAFTVDQIMQVAQQHGIRFDEFTPELLTVIANMMYSDYKDTVKGDISMYVKLAKDFLCDEDFDGEPEEKAYLYYNAIVNKEDE